jgi:alpha-2-macroglobulin
MRLKSPLCLLVIFSIWTSILAPFGTAQKTLNPSPNQVSGFDFRLSEAPKSVEVPPERTPVPVENLSAAETAAIFDRMPPLPVENEDDPGFKMRDASLKPPKTGNIVPIKFPADENIRRITPETVQNLRVERFSPTGKTPLAVDLSVTFSQPMVALASQTETRETVPIRLTPEVKGRWRWLGTTTLIFEAEQRFPMATVFTATVPKGTRSAAGAVLEKDFSWSFTTPPPVIESFVPQDKYRENFPEHTIMAAKFNQEIDEKEILSKISVTAGGKTWPIRSVSGEVDPRYMATESLGEAKPRHWLAFRTVELLPLDAEVRVVFEKGLPSAEGPGKSAGEQAFTFKTMGPFKLTAAYCGYRLNTSKCEPSADFRLQFNRSLFPNVKLDPSLIKVEPAIEGGRIEPDGSWSSIYIRGNKKPNTRYKVTLSGEAIDFYKLKVGNDISAEFEVGVENPQFFAEGGNFVTLDPHAAPSFSIYTKNHPTFKIKLYSVRPEDYQSFLELLNEDRNNGRAVPTPKFGRLIFDKIVETAAEIDVFTETRINLSDALPNKFGHAVLIAEPLINSEDNMYQYYNQPFMTWIQSTDIGLDTLTDYEKMTVLATELQTGKPLRNTSVSVISYQTPLLDSTTNENGIAEFGKPEINGSLRLIARNNADSAILDTYVDWRTYWQNGGLRWFVFDDRKMYRPNEEVSVKGYLRKVTGGKFTDLAEFGNTGKNITYVLRDGRNIEIAKGTVTVNAFGAFDFKIKLPDNLNLGYQRLEFRSESGLANSEFTHIFQAQEFRRPEFEVTVEAETPAPYMVGNSAVFSAAAKYYTGGGLANTEMRWAVSAGLANYSPPNHESFTFGAFVPWWRHYSDDLPTGRSFYNYPQESLTGTTDAAGKHRVNLDFVAANPARPYNLRMVAELQDVNRQTIADTKFFLVHPSEVYVGLRSPKAFVRQGQPLVIEAIATGLDGQTVSGAPIEISAVLKDWEHSGGSSREVVVDTQKCSLTSTDKPAACNFTVKQGGRFTITATVRDAKERPNTSELDVWAAGGNTPPKRGVEEDAIELIPDKKDYAPGETAEILVNAPYFPVEGIMTLERNGIVKTERFTMNEASTVLQVPLEERFLPNIHVKVDLIGNADRINDKGEIDPALPKRPAFASGDLNLNVSTASRKLNVSVAPLEKTTEPGRETKINIEVKDHLGAPVAGSEVALVAVDESVLSLTDYKIANPLDAFYQPIANNVAHLHSRAEVVLRNPGDDFSARSMENLSVVSRQVLETVSLDGADSTIKGRNIRTETKAVYKQWLKKDVAYIITEKEKKDFISVRRNFNALAIFSPSVKTDPAGKAVVDMKLPDNLTRYRITAIAVTKSKQFGLGESNVTARQDLMVRPSAPRFMNFGDRAELPVVLQNQSDKPLTVNLAIRGANARFLEGNGRRVTIAAGDRAEIRFPIAVEAAGTARFQVGAVSGRLTDAAEFAFPVYTPATTEDFATYGTTDENGAILQSVKPPDNVFPQFGGLEVTTSSTQLQELTEAFIYLQNYPFECTEQISSRILSVAALRDVLQAFEAKDLPTPEEIEAKMTSDIERLRSLQHSDGGFSFWRADDASLPYISIHVIHALARAKAKGYKVPDEVIDRSLNYYLKDIESHFPKEYSEESRRALSAYALYVRDLLGEKDAAKAKKLIAEAGLEKLSAESLGWLLAVLADDQESAEQATAIKQNLLNRVTETAGAAHFVTGYSDGEYVLLSSARRADAVILEALLKAEPANGLIPKIVRGLLAAKTRGRWQSTQENAFVLVALDKYFQTYEKTTPNFVARLWLGNSFAGEQKFAGRSVDSNSINVPMRFLQQTGGKPNLIMDRQGAGRLYYRIAMKYALKDLKLEPADYGFEVSRSYEALDDPEDVKQNPDGSWTIKSGVRVRVRLKMIALTRRYHVALVDNLPAGLEIINPGLAVSSNNDALNYDSDEMRKRSYWIEHQNFRDNRAEAFTTLLSEGVWNYSYLARATTPGSFIVPPAKAEEMYAPETFGRSKTSFVKVE